jgi:hypothetical protein
VSGQDSGAHGDFCVVGYQHPAMLKNGCDDPSKRIEAGYANDFAWNRSI